MLQCTDTITGHTDRVWYVSWSPDGQLLASCGSDKTVRVHVFDTQTQKWRCRNVLEGQHTRTIRCVAWSPNGKYLACASFDGTTSIWERQQNDFEYFATLEGHENEVKSVSWDSSGSLIATCGRDKTVWIWASDDQSDFDCLEVLNGHTQDVKSVLWHPNREMLISASYDDTIRCWTEDVDEWSCADTLRGHTSTVWSIALNKEGTHLASSSDDLNVIIWKLFERNNSTISADKAFEWKEVGRISGAHKRTIYGISWSNDEKRDLIATACGDDALRVFGREKSSKEELPFVELAHAEQAHETDINSVAWNPVQTDVLATAADDHTVKIWKFA